MRRFIFFILTSLVLDVNSFAQQPTVSAITVTDIDTTSFRVFYNVSGVPNAWSEILYGTQSGTYLYNTKSINCYGGPVPCQSTGKTALTITGLKPGT